MKKMVGSRGNAKSITTFIQIAKLAGMTEREIVELISSAWRESEEVDMKKEYVDRDKVIAMMEDVTWYRIAPNGQLAEGARNSEEALYRANDVYEIFMDVPAADVAEVRHGRWEMKEDERCYWFECSECGEEPAKTNNNDDYLSVYCPHCGVKMSVG